MKCVCFLQPSEDSLEALELELAEPKYSEYYLCQSVNYRTVQPTLCRLLTLIHHFHFFSHLDFSNILSKSAIERLAEADEYEVIREVQVARFPPI